MISIFVRDFLRRLSARVRQLFLQVLDSHDYEFKNVYYNRAYCYGAVSFQFHAA